MEMEVEEIDGLTLVRLNGRFDIEGSQAVDAQFKALAAKAGALAVDMSEVTFLASLGVRTLMLSAKALRQRGAPMAVFGAQANVEKVLRATGFNEIVSLCGDWEAARAALQT